MTKTQATHAARWDSRMGVIASYLNRVAGRVYQPMTDRYAAMNWLQSRTHDATQCGNKIETLAQMRVGK